MVCFFDCNDLDLKLVINWIGTNTISQPEEKLKHKKIYSKLRDPSLLTRKWSENFVVNQKSARGFTSSKKFLKTVSSSLFIGRYFLSALQSSCKKLSNKDSFFTIETAETGIIKNVCSDYYQIHSCV